MKKDAMFAGIALVCLLSACNEEKSGIETAAATRAEPIPGPGLQRLVDIAAADLASRLAIDVSSIELVDAQYVTWRDSSLGCPEPDYEYMQALTHGSRIKLSAENHIYQYHSGGNRPPFWCEHPDRNEPLPYAPGET